MIDPAIHFGRLGNQLFQYAYIYAQCKKGEIPDIFVQDFKYFDRYREEIRQLFGEGINELPYVALHLRVGKNPLNPNEPAYSENSFYVNLIETDYYEKALKLFPEKDILVFSDDNDFALDWATKNILNNAWTLDKSENAIDALNRMAGCHGIIIGNSSLSWWGAYLSTGKLPKVYPSKWFNDNIKRVGFPDDWIEVQCIKLL